MAGSVEITLTGLLLTDPELHVTTAGAVVSFMVAADGRCFDPAAGRWVDTGATFLPCSIGPQAAQNVAESLTKGTRVLVTGVLRQREWETTEGDKRYAYEVHASEIGVSLNYATVQITTIETTGGSQIAVE